MRKAPMAFVLGAGMSLAALAQGNLDEVVIKTTHVAGPVYMLEGQGGNIGVSAGDDGMLMIDDQFAPLAPKIKTAMNELGSDLKFLLNTHFHGDHAGGNKEFGAESVVVAHENVRTRLAAGQFKAPEDKAALPVVTFAETASIHFNGEEIKLIHLPNGHTDGDSVMYFTDSNVVHMGDHFFAGKFPFVDVASGGNAVKYAENVKRVIDMMPDDVKIIPGHGPLSTLDDLKTFHGMLVETIDAIRKAKADGKSPDEIATSEAITKWTGWGDGFISAQRWVAIVSSSLE